MRSSPYFSHFIEFAVSGSLVHKQKGGRIHKKPFSTSSWSAPALPSRSVANGHSWSTGPQFAMKKGDFAPRQGQQDGGLLLLKLTLCCGHLWERLVKIHPLLLAKREPCDPSSEFPLLQGGWKGPVAFQIYQSAGEENREDHWWSGKTVASFFGKSHVI